MYVKIDTVAGLGVVNRSRICSSLAHVYPELSHAIIMLQGIIYVIIIINNNQDGNNWDSCWARGIYHIVGRMEK